MTLPTKLPKQRTTKLVIGLVVVALAVTGLVLVFNKKDKTQVTKEPVQTVTILPVPEPKAGERLRDIPAIDQQKRIDFLKAGAAAFNMPPSAEVTQQAVASACTYDATAQITNDARASEAYRNDTEKIRADVQAVNRNCWAKYADTDYVPPEPGPSHTDPNTLETHH